MEVMLRLKHWQIFLLTFGLVMVSAGLTLAIDMLDFMDNILLMRVTELISILGFLFGCLWIYAIVTIFYEKLPKEEDINLARFKSSLFILVAYQLITTIILPSIRGEAYILSLAFSLIAFVCGIYIYIVAANMLVAVERQQAVTFGDFTGDFFAFLFYPIGVWWLQPRINRIANNEKEAADPDAPLDQHVSM